MEMNSTSEEIMIDEGDLPSKPIENQPKTFFDIEKERNLLRSQRFDIEYQEPKKSNVIEPKRRSNVLRRLGLGGGRKELPPEILSALSSNPDDDDTAAADNDEVVHNEGIETEKTEFEWKPLEERKNVSAWVQKRPEVIHIYGTDEMSTEQVFDCFDSYDPIQIEWINDSSCNLIFEDQSVVNRILTSVDILNENQTEVSSNEIAPDNLDHLWKNGPKFKKRQLLIRIATVEDVKIGSKKRSRYYQKLFEKRRREKSHARSHRRKGDILASLDGELDNYHRRGNRNQIKRK